MKSFFKRITSKKLHFRTRIMISLIIFAFVITIFMGIISMQISAKQILTMSEQLSESNFNVVYNSLDSYFHNVEKYSTLIIRIPELQKLLKNDSYNNDEKVLLDALIDRSVLEITSLASSSDSLTFNTVNIYCKNGYKYNFIQDTDFPYHNYEECLNYYIENGYIESGYRPSTWCDIVRTTDDSGENVISFINIRTLYNAATMEDVGILVTGINELDLYGYYSDFSNDAYIVHDNGSVISHKNKKLLGSSMNGDPVFNTIASSTASMDTISYKVNNDTQIVTYKKLASNDIVFIVPFDYFSSNMSDTNQFYISIAILILFGLIASIIFSMFISKGLSSSVLSLKKTVEAVQNGDLNARFSSARFDEVSYLGETFNTMMGQINKYFLDQKESERTKRTLELKLMQSQINPHLLYNTLDSTIWALENKNLAQAKKLIVSLSEFFKITLSGGNSLIPLEKELTLINNYINIQKLARKKNITLVIKCPKELMKLKIIKLTIQPIVENSILHGFSGFREDGQITISVKKDSTNKSISIEITDNGIGMMAEEIKKVNTILKSTSLQNISNHFGLYNIQRRIKNMFGDEYGISIQSEVGSHTTITMKLPQN